MSKKGKYVSIYSPLQIKGPSKKESDFPSSPKSKQIKYGIYVTNINSFYVTNKIYSAYRILAHPSTLKI